MNFDAGVDARHTSLRPLALLLLALLASCSTLGPRDGPIAAVSSLPEQWRSYGKIALRAASGGEHRVLRYRLEQRGEDFTLRLSGLFGLGAVVIEQQGRNVTLLRGGKPLQQAGSAEALLLAQTGLDLPVSLLRYWLGGKPGPRALAAVSERSGSGFSQAGWQVSYLALAEYDGYTLPRKLRAEGEPGSVTIAVAGWQL